MNLYSSALQLPKHRQTDGLLLDGRPEGLHYYFRERSAVISRPRMKAPASQAGAARVPSSQSFNAPAD
jgi:hypothetical protein